MKATCAPFEQTLGRAVHVNLHSDATWQELLKSDPVVQQIVRSPTIKILPYAKTGIRAVFTGTI